MAADRPRRARARCARWRRATTPRRGAHERIRTPSVSRCARHDPAVDTLTGSRAPREPAAPPGARLLGPDPRFGRRRRRVEVAAHGGCGRMPCYGSRRPGPAPAARSPPRPAPRSDCGSVPAWIIASACPPAVAGSSRLASSTQRANSLRWVKARPSKRAFASGSAAARPRAPAAPRRRAARCRARAAGRRRRPPPRRPARAPRAQAEQIAAIRATLNRNGCPLMVATTGSAAPSPRSRPARRRG